MAKRKRTEEKREAPGREELAERLVESMGVIMRVRGSVLRSAMSRYGVTLPQFFLLKMVGNHGELNVTQISGIMMVAPPTASRMIDNLCAKGLLQRQKDPSNRRVTCVSLTREGKEIMRKLGDMHKAELLRLMGEAEVGELRELVDLLEGFAARLTEALEKEEGP